MAMAKAKKDKQPAHNAGDAKQTNVSRTMLSDLKASKNLWYKLRVLIYDLHNIKNDRASASRLDRTVDELYLSAPYFSVSEAALIRAALVETTTATTETAGDDVNMNTISETISHEEGHSATKAFLQTVEEAIKARFRNFCNKRKASGDFRPCGPHDLAPVYLGVFGIVREEVEEEAFLGRLRRSGLG